jgi:hypothetical protein
MPSGSDFAGISCQLAPLLVSTTWMLSAPACPTLENYLIEYFTKLREKLAGTLRLPKKPARK